MSDLALKIENLSKWYRLGTISTGSLRQDMKRWWVKDVLKRSDPFFETYVNENSSGYIWALENINFDVKAGEVWGFVGSNGAGKSTLLKIISRIVKPTKGTIQGKGVISSLLEVGTGFHQELSGRENIYISGYLLGMKKHEIRKNFDAIIEFSGIERFIDTPVKRYSSGMHVRLAFAIAAHLDPDVLIIDEVLAVGDAEFQKKCLGKMKEVAKEKGRTILFVSHNMQAVKQLCQKAIWLEKGKQKAIGDAHTIINQYVTNVQKNQFEQQWIEEDAPGNAHIKIRKVQLLPQLKKINEPIDTQTPLEFKIEFSNLCETQNLHLGLQLFSYSGECIFDLVSSSGKLNRGKIEGSCTIPGNFLNDGSYYISVSFFEEKSNPLFHIDECISFEVEDFRKDASWYGKWIGSVRPQFPFLLQQKSDVQLIKPV